MNYANPNVLVSTDWVEESLSDAGVVIVEVDVDTSAYDEGHIPGAIGWNWKTQLSDPLQGDILSRDDMQSLLQMSGIHSNQTVVLYGDNNNWFAAWAFWQLKLYGFQDVRMMDGRRKKLLAEGRKLSKLKQSPKRSEIEINDVNNELRSMLFEVQQHYKTNDVVLVDVRSSDEFTGKILAPPGLPETCQRGGHISGAQNVGWGEACNDDGTFKSAAELKALRVFSVRPLFLRDFLINPAHGICNADKPSIMIGKKMNIFLKWSGIISIVVMISTLLISLTMMWHPDWMSRDVTPISQRLTQIAGIAGILIGLVGGPLMIALGQWEVSPIAFRIFNTAAFALALVATVRIVT